MFIPGTIKHVRLEGNPPPDLQREVYALEKKSTSTPLAGFTLIELILVLVIIGFLTSLVAPAITSTTGLRLKTTTKKVAAGLRFARSQAVISGSTYRATFDLDKGQVTVESLASDDCGHEPKSRPPTCPSLLAQKHALLWCESLAM